MNATEGVTRHQREALYTILGAMNTLTYLVSDREVYLTTSESDRLWHIISQLDMLQAMYENRMEVSD
jgi:hypothetical protein